jgi:hypothetical protein
MGMPIANYALTVTTNINICTIVVGQFPTGVVAGTQFGCYVIDLADYFIVAGSSGVGTVVTFQQLGGDGTWRAMVSPAPITLANSTTYNPGVSPLIPLNGPAHGFRLSVSGVVGNGIAFAELIGTVRMM